MASLSSLPTVSATISLRLAASVAADIQSHWLAQRLGAPGTLAGAMAAADTSFLFRAGVAGGAYAVVPISVGQTLMIDGEAMTVEAVDTNTVTVARNVAPLAPPAAAHAEGAAVFVLRYPSPWMMIADEALRPWAQQIVTQLGNQSATFGAAAEGTLTLNP